MSTVKLETPSPGQRDQATWMQTTGACQFATTTAGSGALSQVVHASGYAPLLLYVLLYGLDTYASRQWLTRTDVRVRLCRSGLSDEPWLTVSALSS